MNHRLSKELLDNFFGENYYITFNNNEEKKEFLKYISFFDLRYKCNDEFEEEFLNRVESVVWKYSKNLKHHQLEWSDDKLYFKNKDCDLKELDYKEVSEYVKLILDTYEENKDFLSFFDELLNKLI